MLVIVEDGDIKSLLELVFDDEAFGSLDVLQIDAAEGGGHHFHGPDDFLGVFGIKGDGDGVHTCEALEEDGLALHDGQACACADGAQAQDGSAVGDYCHQIALGSIVVNLLRLILDGQAGGCYPGTVGQGQVALGVQGYLAHDFDFALAFLMELERSLIHIFLFHK